MCDEGSMTQPGRMAYRLEGNGEGTRGLIFTDGDQIRWGLCTPKHIQHRSSTEFPCDIALIAIGERVHHTGRVRFGLVARDGDQGPNGGGGGV